jgi:MFS family permease
MNKKRKTRVHYGYWVAAACFAIQGISIGGFFTVISPIVAELFGIGSHGVLFGVVGFSGTVGGAIGPFLAGHIFDITLSYQLVFFILTGVSIIGLILISLLKPALNGV